jgi:hypothetical protein
MLKKPWMHDLISKAIQEKSEAYHPVISCPGASRLPFRASGYERTVPAALVLLAALEAHMVVPAAVAEHIRRLATDHPVA